MLWLFKVQHKKSLHDLNKILELLKELSHWFYSWFDPSGEGPMFVMCLNNTGTSRLGGLHI